MEYIDLGLSVKWATCNVGATKPEDCGDYFAWGEIIPKNIYFTETYLPNKNFNKIFKLPTRKEFKELIDECTWTWTTLNGVEGYNVEGSNGNSIFLPAAGIRYDSGVEYVRNDGNYWSASGYDGDNAYCLYFTSRIIGLGGNGHHVGQPIRLVKKIF